MPHPSYFQRIAGGEPSPVRLSPPRRLFRPEESPIEAAAEPSPMIATRAPVGRPVSAPPRSPSGRTARDRPPQVVTDPDEPVIPPVKVHAGPVIPGPTRLPEPAAPPLKATDPPSPATNKPRMALVAPAPLADRSPPPETPAKEAILAPAAAVSRAVPPPEVTPRPQAQPPAIVSVPVARIDPRAAPPVVTAGLALDHAQRIVANPTPQLPVAQSAVPTVAPVVSQAAAPVRSSAESPSDEPRIRPVALVTAEPSVAHRANVSTETAAVEKTRAFGEPRAIEPERPPIRLEPPTAVPRPRQPERPERAAGVRIGSLEVRIVEAETGKGPPVRAPVVASRPSRPAPPSSSSVRLSRGFSAFGLVQG